MNIGDVFYEKHTVEALSKRTGEPSITKCEKANAIEIFDGMTNGDVIKAVFPNVSIYKHGSTYSINNEYNFNETWWDAPYKREVEE